MGKLRGGILYGLLLIGIEFMLFACIKPVAAVNAKSGIGANPLDLDETFQSVFRNIKKRRTQTVGESENVIPLVDLDEAFQSVLTSISERRTLTVERILRGKKKKQGAKEPNSFEDILKKECHSYYLALNSDSPTKEQINALVDCFERAIVEQLGMCLGNWPGFWNPLHCYIAENFEQHSDEISETEMESDSSGNQFIKDGSHYKTAAFRSPSSINEEFCIECFGEKYQPKPITCAALANIDDIKGFYEAFRKRFRKHKKECGLIREEMKTLDIGDPEAFKLIINVLQPLLDSFKSNAFTCNNKFELKYKEHLEKYIYSGEGGGKKEGNAKKRRKRKL